MLFKNMFIESFVSVYMCVMKKKFIDNYICIFVLVYVIEVNYYF